MNQIHRNAQSFLQKVIPDTDNNDVVNKTIAFHIAIASHINTLNSSGDPNHIAKQIANTYIDVLEAIQSKKKLGE